MISENVAQLKPYRIGDHLFSEACKLPEETVPSLWEGVSDGFRIVDNVDIPEYECANYKSILEDKFYGEILEDDILEGGVSRVDDRPHCVHAIGGIEKSNGKLRPITDCSMPDNVSVNNFMDSTCKRFSNNSVDSLAQILEQDDFLCVTDIASVFRSVSIHPDNRKYQGLSWETEGNKSYYVENLLCFGLKCASYIFDLPSQLVVDIATSKGIVKIVNYLDDFAIEENSEQKCRESQYVLIGILRKMGFAVAWSKLESPARRVKLLVIIVDSEKMNLSLPKEKVDKLMDLIRSAEEKGSASKRVLECIAGHMAHCAAVITGGRTFSRRVYVVVVCHGTVF